MSALTDNEIELFEEDYEVKDYEDNESSYEEALFLNIINLFINHSHTY